LHLSAYVSLGQDKTNYRKKRTFAHSEYESDSKKRSKRFTGRVGEQGNCPDEDVDADCSLSLFSISLGQAKAHTSSICRLEVFAKPDFVGTDERMK
jgi:hypothetical protein